MDYQPSATLIYRGFTLACFDALPSTQDIARRWVEGGSATHHQVALAQMQTEGKGTRGRIFSSPRGGLYFTLVELHEYGVRRGPLLSLGMALCVAQEIAHWVRGTLTQVKWPNDVLLDGKKVCGILGAVMPEQKAILIGVGINANTARQDLEAIAPREDGLRPTSLAHFVGTSVPIMTLMHSILDSYLELTLSAETKDPTSDEEMLRKKIGSLWQQWGRSDPEASRFLQLASHANLFSP